MTKKRPVFAIALSVTFLLAITAPTAGQWLYDQRWPSTGIIMLMYLGMGLNTDTSMLKTGLSQWKLHLSVQFALFIIAPLMSFVLFMILASQGYGEGAVGLLFVGAIPSTITSCIMLTKRYGGNAVGSLYNAVLSQILGVVITPLILSIVLTAQFETVSSFGTVLLSLVQKMILPFIVGQFLQQFKHRLGKPGQVVSFYGIFFILYMNLAKVASQGNLGNTLGALAIPLLAAIVLCTIQIFATYSQGLILRLSIEDRIALVFTGSQKTLGMGVPLTSIYFANSANIAIDATLVIIVYYLAAMILTVAVVPLITRSTRVRNSP